MTRNINILNELKEISPAVADLEATNPYTVPTGYFETLTDVIMAKIAGEGNENEESRIIKAAGKTMPLNVPAGYFETLSDSILAKLKIQLEQTPGEEINEMSPLLAGLAKTNVFTVPDGYFETIAQKQLELIAEPRQTKVVTLFTQQTWMRLAAAASVIIMLAFGIHFFVTKSNTQLDSYVKLGLKNYNTEQQLTNGITGINEADLVTYLQMTADSKDAETIALLVDETQLPDEADYLDNEFLESFMNELEQTETKTN